MTPLIPSKDESMEPGTASEAEKNAIREFIKGAQKASPGAQVRYVQRNEDTLIVSLRTASIDDSENFALYALAHQLNDQNGIDLVVTQSSLPSDDKELLALKTFLLPDQISADAKEPAVSPKSFWTKTRQPYRYVLTRGIPLAIVATLFMEYAFLPALHWAQQTYPEIFPGGTTSPVRFEQKAPVENQIQFIKDSIDQSIQDTDTQINQSKTLNLTKQQVVKLRKEKTLLEKARTDLNE